MKGWTPTCIAVFHNAFGTLQLLLEHGGDPSIKSSYNKNAWDLSKDELDAAGKVVKSRQEIRQILIDHENSTATASKLFGNSSVSPSRAPGNMYQDLDPNGSPIVMQLEMEGGANSCSCEKKNTKTTSKKDGTKNSATKKKKSTGKKEK
jgi:ankyrin repeat protein